MAERITFPGASGEPLAGKYHHASGERVATALFAHCFTCSKDLRAAVRIAEALAIRGISVLRFDFTGLGESAGEFADTTFSSNVEDLVAAAAYLRDVRGQAPSALIGHSLGGAAVLAAAAHISESVCVATIGAPADPAHVRHLLSDAETEIAARGEAEVILAGRAFRIKRAFLDDLETHSLRDRVKAMNKPLLICHAPRDQLVGIDNARLLFEAARHPKSFVSLDDADHLLTRPRDACYVGNLIAAWAERYVTRDQDEPSVEGQVVVRGGPSGYAQNIRAGRHSLRADEPASIPGGTDTGPSPYDLLLASLGACTSMTLRMYADRKGWPLEAVTVALHHKKIHARDCEECETRTGRIDSIEREIAIDGTLDDAQRQRMLEIADKCPVHRTLNAEVRIASALRARDDDNGPGE